MKLSNTLGAATLALSVAATGCDKKDSTGVYPKPESNISAEMLAQEASAKAKASASSAPTAVPAPAQAPAPTQTAAPAPAPAPTTAPAVVSAPTGPVYEIADQKLAGIFEEVCKEYEHRIKPFVVHGNKVYSLCLDASNKVVEVLSRGEDTKASAMIDKAFMNEDSEGTMHYFFALNGLNYQNTEYPLVITTSGAENKQNTDESNQFWGHDSWDDVTGTGNLTGLPFPKNALIVEAYPDLLASMKYAKGQLTTPKKTVVVEPPKQPAQPKGPSEHDRKQDKQIADLGRRLDANDAETASLKGQLDNLSKGTPVKGTSDLDRVHEERAQQKD